MPYSLATEVDEMATVPATSSLTVFEWHARLIERASIFLAHTLETTADDRLSWSPNCEGDAKARNALEQVGECIGLNKMAAAVLTGATLPAAEGHESPLPPANVAEASKALLESGKEFAQVVRGLDDSALQNKYKLPFAELTGAVILDIVCMNMQYHAGQIAYIQLMCGDPVFHIPPELMEF
jgi:hypothetical protein